MIKFVPPHELATLQKRLRTAECDLKINQPRCHMSSSRNQTCQNVADINLSEGCFGTEIAQKYTEWSQMGAHRLKIGQIFAKIQCAHFGFEQIRQKRKYCSKYWNRITSCKQIVYSEMCQYM